MPGVIPGVSGTHISGAHRVWKELFKDITASHTELGEQRQRLIEIIKMTSEARNLELREKDWQVDAAGSVILGSDVCVVVPTGGGKSFCYQLMALCCPGRTLLVVTPLVALGKDQVRFVSTYIVVSIKVDIFILMFIFLGTCVCAFRG